MGHYSKYISIDPNTRFGRPCLTSTRISVYHVLGWLASGMTREQIMLDYPEVTSEMIQACLAYAADREHRIRYAS